VETYSPFMNAGISSTADYLAAVSEAFDCAVVTAVEDDGPGAGSTD
jgi:hypothetical protein